MHCFREEEYDAETCSLGVTQKGSVLLHRNPIGSIEQGGFLLQDQEQFSVEGLGLISPHCAGIAVAEAA